MLLFWNDRRYVTLSKEMRILWKDYRTVSFKRGIRFGICILFAGYTNSGTFIGPPRLERETRIRESPVRVPTGTTTVSGSVRIRTGYEAELSNYDPGIPSLRKKLGNGIAWLKGRETRGWMDYQWPLFGNAMNAWDVKLGIVGLGRKISCHV